MSSGAIRVRRHRQRLKDGLAVLQIEVAELLLAERLIEVGLLDPDAADNREQLALAVERAVRLWAEAPPIK